MAYTPPDYGGYERAKGDVEYSYGKDAATNAYGRFISQQRGSRGLADTSRQFGRQTPLFKSQCGQRGLANSGVQSGVMQNSMNNYLGDYARNYGRQQQDLTQNLQQYDMNQSNLDAWRTQQLGSIEASKARAIADDAAQLEWLRSIVGGL